MSLLKELKEAECICCLFIYLPVCFVLVFVCLFVCLFSHLSSLHNQHNFKD